MEPWVIGLIVLLVSGGVVLLTSLFKNVNWSDRVKNILALGLSAVAGVVTDLASKNWDLAAYANLDILTTVLVIYGAAQLIYNFIMKGTAVEATLSQALYTDPSEGGQ